MRMWMTLLSFWMSFQVTPEKIVSYLEKRCSVQQNNTEFITPEALRVASVQIRMRNYLDLKSYLDDMLSLTEAAVKEKAQLVVFPEYVGLLAMTFLPGYKKLFDWLLDGKRPESLDQVNIKPYKMEEIAEYFQNYIYETYICTFGTLARLLHVYIAAGSCILCEGKTLYNRSILFGPEGEPVGMQDKTAALCLDQNIGVKPSSHIEIFETPMGKISIVLGSDAYYFENVKAAAEQDVRLILVPDSRGGVTPDIVRCRAEENGIFAVYSCYSSPKNETVKAGIMAPFSMTPGHTGTFSQAEGHESGIVSARLNLEKLPGRTLEANPRFLAGDYLHSYVYSGKFPMPRKISGLLGSP